MNCSFSILRPWLTTGTETGKQNRKMRDYRINENDCFIANIVFNINNYPL